MNEQSQDQFFWQLIHHLVFKENMSAFKIKSKEKEIWLEKEDAKEVTVIRIFRHDFSWNNYIHRDLENVAKYGEKVRKDLKTRQVMIYNLYVSSLLPVDFDAALLNESLQSNNKRVTIRSLMIDSERGNDVGIAQVQKALDCIIPIMTETSVLSTDDGNLLRTEVIRVSEKKIKAEKALFTYGKPLFTTILLLNVIVIFAFMEYVGSSTSLLTLVEFGAKYDPLIQQGEWWRFFTSIFLHIGFLHLVMNSFALYYLGSVVERIYGTTRFVVIYVLAGLLGSISSFVFNNQVSAGASGAIFGCFGALLYFGIVHRKLFFRTMGLNLLVILALNLTFGFLVPMIDNSAHIGGLVGGFLAASFLHLPRHRFQKRQLILFFVTVSSFVVLIVFGYSMKEDTEKMHVINVQIAQELLQKGDVERAYPLLKAAVIDEVDIIEANFLLAYSEARLGLLKDAEKNLLITLDQRPYLHEAHFNLSLVYYELRQYLDAYRSVEKAIELKPSGEDYIKLKNSIEKVLAKIG